MRSPRFRRVPFRRNGVSDHGRAIAPRIAVRNMLPSTLSTASASAKLSLSRLNIPLRVIAVYASRPPSPTATQHSLKGGALPPYPHRTFTGWNAPASPGALITDFFTTKLATLKGTRVSLVNQFKITLRDFLPDPSDGKVIIDRARFTSTTVSNRLYAELSAYAYANKLPLGDVVAQLREEIHREPGE